MKQLHERLHEKDTKCEKKDWSRANINKNLRPGGFELPTFKSTAERASQLRHSDCDY